jgi:AcrR family transcriptional regulator
MVTKEMKYSCLDVRSQRREQIIDAAVSVIAERGLQNLSLSEIEKKAGMSRGQLTYYFPTKDEILLAVFDRHIQTMYHRVQADREPCNVPVADWDWIVRHLLEMVLRVPGTNAEFQVLHYTFLSQIGHREDFRQRLAELYSEWRHSLAAHLQSAIAGRHNGNYAPQTVASFVQALLHGIAIQLAADSKAFDRQEMLKLCLDLLGSYLQNAGRPSPNGHPAVEPNELPAGCGE